jgi:hypothetical protein
MSNPLDGHAMARVLGGCKERSSARKKKQRRRRRETGKQYQQKVSPYIKLPQEGTWAETWRAKRKWQAH